eukprot:Gb_33749 [translate_table: standard]
MTAAAKTIIAKRPDRISQSLILAEWSMLARRELKKLDILSGSAFTIPSPLLPKALRVHTRGGNTILESLLLIFSNSLD